MYVVGYSTEQATAHLHLFDDEDSLERTNERTNEGLVTNRTRIRVLLVPSTVVVVTKSMNDGGDDYTMNAVLLLRRHHRRRRWERFERNHNNSSTITTTLRKNNTMQCNSIQYNVIQ